MRENKFKKFLRQDSQVSLDEKIKKFNNKMDGVDTLSEKMTTGSVYPKTETQPYIPPTTSDVPDTSGLTDTAVGGLFAGQPTNGGDASDPSTWDTGWNTNAHLLNGNELDGQTNRPITFAPDIVPEGGSGIVYCNCYYGTAIGYIDQNNTFQTVLSGGLTGGTNLPNELYSYYPEGSPQRELYNLQVSFWNAHVAAATAAGFNPNQAYVHYQYTSYVKAWIMHTDHHHGPFASHPGPKKTGFILRSLGVVNGFPGSRNSYTSDPGQERTLVLNRMGDPDSEYSYPGYIDIGNMLGVSPRGLDYLDQKSFAELYNTKSGRELAKLADAGLISIPAAVAVGKLLIAGGMAAVAAYGQQQGWGQDIVNAVVNAVSSDPYGRDQAGPTTTGSNPGARTLTPQQQAEVEAAGKELSDAQRALNDAEESGNQTQIDMAKERVDRASKRRQSLRKKHREENKNRKESSDLKGEVLTEGWQSPEHTTVEKDPKKRWLSPNAGTDSKKWFDPQQIAPEYPVNPPEMIDGYNSKSNLAPKEVSKDDYLIKITKKDLVRNHKLKGSEIAHLMETINRINKYLASHPEELIHAQKRYPKHDARLAQLNWEMDTMLSASKNYLDSQFPENKRLYDKLTKETEKSIKLTDPDTYKKPDSKLVGVNKLMRVQNVMDSYGPLINLRLEKKLELEKNILENKKKEKELKTQKQNEELAKILHNDWRSELQEVINSSGMDDTISNDDTISEGMTSSGLFSVALEPQGEDILTSIAPTSDQWQNYGSLSADGTFINFGGGTSTPANAHGDTWSSSHTQIVPLDTTAVDTISMQISVGTGYDAPLSGDSLYVLYYAISNTGEPYVYNVGVLGEVSVSGTYNFTLPKDAQYKRTFLQLYVANSRSGQDYYDSYIVPKMLNQPLGNIYVYSSGMAKDIFSTVNLFGPNVDDDTKDLIGGVFMQNWGYVNAENNNPHGRLELPSWSVPPPQWHLDAGGTYESWHNYGNTRSDRIWVYDLLINTFSNPFNSTPRLYSINNVGYKRRTPMNVFVPLDSPEATAFIRTDPIMQGLSPNQRYKKLLEMLDAGDEYLLKALGMQGSKARPAEVQMPQSWQQAASQPSYMNIQVGDQQYVSQDGQVQTDTTRGIKDGEMDGRPIYYDDQGNMRVSQPQPEYNPTVYNPEIDGGYTHLDYLYGGPEERARIQNIWNQRNKNASTSTTTSTAPPAQNYQKPTPMFDKYGRRTDTGELERGMRTTDPVGDLATLGAAAAITKGGLALAKTGAVGQTIRQVGKVFKPKPTGPVKAKYPTSAKPKPKPSSQYRIDEPLNPTGTSRPPSYSRGRGMGDRWEGPLRNSYEPNGELISEKKKLKSPKEVIANKIPGYYDGKPSPLGFPMEPPAKMVNGMHPDLVDGKKVSDRFNRLDPESAKAMPPTGNPHIDKKVRAAAKKPK